MIGTVRKRVDIPDGAKPPGERKDERMKDMIKRMREEKGGFTLAELLIVVAIVLVLVAIAVPVFTGALGNAEKAVADANIHSVKSAAAAAILTDESYKVGDNKNWTATADVAQDGTVSNLTVSEGAPEGDKAEKKDDGGYTVTVGVTKTDLPKVTGTSKPSE